MSTVQLIPPGYSVHVFNAHIESSNGIPTLTSFFHTVYDGMKAWYRDNYEGKINATLQLFGTPFSLASNLFNIIIRVYQVAAVFGVQTASSVSFFKPMAITGLVVACLEGLYHGYGLVIQLKFAYNFYTRKANPQGYFQYLFRNSLGINRSEKIEIRKKLQTDPGLIGELKADLKIRSAETKIRMAKMLPLARRVQPWLVTEITQTLHDNPYGVPQAKVDEWMELIEIQTIKKIILHVLALTTIGVLGVGLALALAGAPPLIPLILLGISPVLTAAHYLYEYGFLSSYRREFSWINCVPNWIKWVVDKTLDIKLEFTPGESTKPPQTQPPAVEVPSFV